jgi:4-hydroxy-2-oxoheptanedioate aldolase
VQACRYPPDGVCAAWPAPALRGGGVTRTYAKEANAQICLLVQAETRLALTNLDAILATEGIDGVFIGPADLSASLGHVGNPGHPEVQHAIEDAIARITRAGKAARHPDCRHHPVAPLPGTGCLFVAVGLDTQILVRGTSNLLAQFKTPDAEPAVKGDTTYG